MGSYTSVWLINTYIMQISFKIIEICINMKYATILTFNRKVCIYFVARFKSFKIRRRDMQYETHSRTRICMVE